MNSVELKQRSKEKDYRQILLDSRKKQLRLTATAVRRLEVTFNAAIESIAQKIEALPPERFGTPWHRAMLQLTADIRTVLDNLNADNRTLLDVGMVELAQNAADREAAVAELVEAGRDSTLFPEFSQRFSLTNGQALEVSFGRLSLGAVERVAGRYYSDGLKLSDRLWKLNRATQTLVEDTIVQGIAEGTSARDLAKKLREVLKDKGTGEPAPMHRAMRIARTEIRQAHVESHLMSAQHSPGVLKPYISGLRFNLSLSHPAPDICDLYATRDSGMGPGIYLPGEYPTSHPNCLCFSTTVLKEFPESGIGGAVPNPDSVPEGQRQAFNQQFGQPVAA